jgi:murein DD-endopeptidase MepM/ murein hydrolase activator NlpD
MMTRSGNRVTLRIKAGRSSGPGNGHPARQHYTFAQFFIWHFPTGCANIRENNLIGHHGPTFWKDMFSDKHTKKNKRPSVSLLRRTVFAFLFLGAASYLLFFLMGEPILEAKGRFSADAPSADTGPGAQETATENIRSTEISRPDGSNRIKSLSSNSAVGDQRVCSVNPGPFERQEHWLAMLKSRNDKIQSGESLSHVLARLGLDGGESRPIIDAIGELTDLTKIRPGSQVTIHRHEQSGAPVRLEYSCPGSPLMVLIKTPAGYAASRQEHEPVSCRSAVEGNIKHSLWESAVNQYGLEPELVMALADIFRYQIDFLTDIQQDDAFRLLYERQYSQGQPVGVGRVLAVEFINNGTSHKAYFHQNTKGESGYYNENGQSLKGMFLKSPLQYRRISSHFSHSRMHPILKYRRPHLGVDYAAPTGTPVEALGNGKVSFAGRKGGYGNLVIIDHSHGYTTMYAHLNGFAKGITKGTSVKQGQLIGFVGSTGLSTGPHLDFRVKKDGKFIDPLSIKLQPTPAIEAREKSEYLKQVSLWRAEMSRLLASSR